MRINFKTASALIQAFYFAVSAFVSREAAPLFIQKEIKVI